MLTEVFFYWVHTWFYWVPGFSILIICSWKPAINVDMVNEGLNGVPLKSLIRKILAQKLIISKKNLDQNRQSEKKLAQKSLISKSLNRIETLTII